MRASSPKGPGASPRRRSARAAQALALLLCALAVPARAEPLSVEVTNASEPVLCAEKDNVTLNLASPKVRHFRIEAAHPAYLGSIGLGADSVAADWTACDMSGDAAHKSDVKAPTRRTLYEEPDFWLVGWTMPTYWRPAAATVRIGGRVEKGLHLLQLWMIRPMGGEEVLVVYPQDGYWRVRPLAPPGRAATAFGSSFLVGPVEIEGRPIVRLNELAFDPKTRTFGLGFAKGGTASVTVTSVDQARAILDITLGQGIEGSPFAALRSMYVTADNNDVAAVAVRGLKGTGWAEAPIMAFGRAEASHVWVGRHAISRHNTSAPDTIFSGFADVPPAPPRR